MKRFAYLFIMPLLFVACQQEYHLYLTVNGELRSTTLDTFEASSDKEACKTAVDYIDSYMSVATNHDDSFYSTVSYGVFKGKIGGKITGINGTETRNNRYSLDEYCPVFLKEQKEKIEVEERKAYGGALFGMSCDEVKALPHFSEYAVISNYLRGIVEPVGNYYYNVYLFFDEEKDELFYVRLSSSSMDALDYDGKLRQHAEDLKSVIEKVYGKPTDDYGYPSFLKVQSGVLNMGYRWRIGTKEIRIGVGTDDYYRARYCVYCMIEDTVRNGERNAKIEEANNKQIQESADLF